MHHIFDYVLEGKEYSFIVFWFFLEILIYSILLVYLTKKSSTTQIIVSSLLHCILYGTHKFILSRTTFITLLLCQNIRKFTFRNIMQSSINIMQKLHCKIMIRLASWCIFGQWNRFIYQHKQWILASSYKPKGQEISEDFFFVFK